MIPTIILIIGWGVQPERLQSSYYFVIYTVLASLPLLLIFFFFFFKIGSFFIYFTIFLNGGLFINNFFLFISLTLAFLIKLPIYGFHLWLPKAHVEAPVGGSIYLAGLLLKLGVYGIYRTIYIKFWVVEVFRIKLVRISILGGLLTSFICLFQFDLKSLVAYASVGHIGLILGGILSGRVWGWGGGFILIVAHGLASSGLFSLVNILYERIHIRSMVFVKGVLIICPILCFILFFLSCCNIAAPLTLNFLSEIFLIISIIKKNFLFIIFVGISSWVCVVYRITLFFQVSHGKIRNLILINFVININQILNLILHFLPLFFFFFFFHLF